MAKKIKEPPKERLFTIEEMAKVLQIDKRTLVEWVQFRRIPYVKVDGQYVRFRLSDIAKWVREKNRPQHKVNLT